MVTFKWSESFATGLDDVDEQHRHLVDVINAAGDLLEADALDLVNLERVFAELASYADYHFDEEEKLMSSRGIDQRHLDAHVAEHLSYREELASMHEQLGPGRRESIDRLLAFLVHWLAYHILDSDQEMATLLRDIGSGKDAAESYHQLRRQRHAAMEPLVTALDGLFEIVSARNQELRELNRTLESKVVERTAALASANQRLEELALTDVLTELPNRRSAMRALRHFWETSRQENSTLACMMIDADRFKQVNDTLGHEAGDAYLCTLARTLRHTVRNDDMVCRLGGDEFLVICPDTPLDGAMHVAELARAAVASLAVPEGANLTQVSVSVGVAVSDAKMKNPEELIRLADQGAYLAKGDGRNCVRSVASQS